MVFPESIDRENDILHPAKQGLLSIH